MVSIITIWRYSKTLGDARRYPKIHEDTRNFFKILHHLHSHFHYFFKVSHKFSSFLIFSLIFMWLRCPYHGYVTAMLMPWLRDCDAHIMATWLRCPCHNYVTAMPVPWLRDCDAHIMATWLRCSCHDYVIAIINKYDYDHDNMIIMHNFLIAINM